jgi:hypothetical protein
MSGSHTKKSIHETFFSDPDALAINVRAESLFGILTRSHDLPADIAALVTTEHGAQSAIAPGARIPADDADTVLMVKTTPFALDFGTVTAHSVDQYLACAQFSCRVSVIPEKSDLASFAGAILSSRGSATKRDLESFLHPYVANALAQIAEGRGVEVLINPAKAQTLLDELLPALNAPAFAAGIQISTPATLTIDSPVYRQVKASKAQRERQRESFETNQRLEDAAKTARLKHADHLNELLERLKSAADDSEHAQLPDLLKTFSESDRGQLYAALFSQDVGDRVTESIAVASGAELVFYDPDSPEKPTFRRALSGAAGAARSVQWYRDAGGERKIYVGAATGIYELNADGSGNVVEYIFDTGEEVRGGANSVAPAGDRIFATHSELGLICFHKRAADEDQEKPLAEAIHADLTRGASAVRCALFDAGWLYFSVDNVIHRVKADDPESDPQSFLGSPSNITALSPSWTGIYAGNAGGQILFWPEPLKWADSHSAAHSAAHSTAHSTAHSAAHSAVADGSASPGEPSASPILLHSGRQRAAETVVLMDFGPVRRLFYTDTSLAVFSRVVDDTFICRYEAGGQTIRRAEVAPDCLVATNEARDRLFLFSMGDPSKPRAVIPVSQTTAHSIQDITLVPYT